jgi:hypothetical protein
VRSMAFQSASKFLPVSRWVLGYLLFIADKFGDLSLQESELPKVVGSGTDRLPLASVQVGPVNEAQLGHGSSVLGEVDSDPSGDKVDHNQAGLPDAIDPIYQSPQESDFDCVKEIYMVG